ncbi:MAG: hypothetical protein MUP70_08615 [Candidatus Aminicenantes bacterium]|nr:hypothetical protein [Candidatus Aminicenantes bacterium]
MTVEKIEKMIQKDDLGFSDLPICTEPWESYYILRRGILPCCYGNPIVAPMSDWKDAWNCSEVQEIRRSLSRGELGPYCRESLGCPIVQRILMKEKEERVGQGTNLPAALLNILRLINRLFFHLPSKTYRRLKS